LIDREHDSFSTIFNIQLFGRFVRRDQQDCFRLLVCGIALHLL